MPRSVSVAFDWAMIAVALGFLIFVLFSPTGSFVRSPMEHTKQLIESRADGGLLAVQASPVAREGLLVSRAD
jgi:hypothetical protein